MKYPSDFSQRKQLELIWQKSQYNCIKFPTSERERLEFFWEEPPSTPRNSLLIESVLKAVWQRLVTPLAPEFKLRVWQSGDSQGNLYWNAYDPVTKRSIYQKTEEELHDWLEKLD